jgi:alpha-glucosidase
MRAVITQTESLFEPLGAWPTWTLSNHDNSRHVNRYGAQNAKAAALLLLCLRGTPFLYYGEEIGTPDVNEAAGHDMVGRDPPRAPMRWDDSTTGGFSNSVPWLPLPPPECSVSAQAQDDTSVLSFYRRLIELRRREPTLRTGSFTMLPAPDGVLAWRRGEDFNVAINMGDRPARVTLEGTIIAATEVTRNGERLRSAVTLEPGEGVLVR